MVVWAEEQAEEQAVPFWEGHEMGFPVAAVLRASCAAGRKGGCISSMIYHSVM
jgi:hypothetical protein